MTTYRREREGRERFTVPAAYVDAVRSVGGVPVLLTPGEESCGEVLAQLDGLVLSGGGDVDPRFSGGVPHGSVYGTSAERDLFEIALVRHAIELGTPTLAICRGLQVLNVARGGTLHTHLPDIVGDKVSHRASQLEATTHAVQVAGDCALAESLGATLLPQVPSWHHQAIDRLGDGLRPVAWAEDGVVEAVELIGSPAMLAVQWHPELDMRAQASGRRLFETFARM